MKDTDKTKGQLIEELGALRQRIAELQTAEAERRQSEEKSRQSEQRYRTILEETEEGYYEIDLAGTFTYVNNTGGHLLGYSHKKMIGMNYRSIFSEQVQQNFFEAFNKVYRTGRPIRNFLFEAVRRGGNNRVGELSIFPLRNENREIIGFRGVGRDITERKRAEEMLADEATRRRILVDQSSDGIVVLDEKGKVYEANQRFAEMLGYSPEEAREIHVWDWDTQWTREQLLEMVRTVDEAGAHLETYHRRKDGTTIDVEISTNGAICAGHKLVFCVCRDITERKQTEKALQASEERYRLLVENAGEGISIVQDGMTKFCNTKAAELTGYSPGELTSMKAVEIVHPDDRERVLNYRTRRMKGEKVPSAYTFRIIDKQGNTKWLLRNVTLLTWEDKPAALVIDTDLTEQKQMEEMLCQSEQRYRLLAENAKDIIFRLQLWPEHKFDYVSPSATAVTGYTPEEHYADPLLGLKLVHPEDRALFETMIQKPESVSTPIAMRWIHKDGATIWVEVQRTFIYDKEGRLVALDGIVRDITERKLAEDALKKSEQRLREAQGLGRLGNWEYDLATKKIEWSDEVYELFERDKALGPPTPEEEARYYTPEEMRRLREFNRIVIKEEKELAIDSAANLPSGKTVFLNAWIRPVKDESGRVIRLFGTIQDITERKKSEEVYQTIIHAAMDGFWLMGIQGCFLDVNDAYCHLTGYSRDEILTLNIQDIEAAETLEATALHIQRIKETGTDRFETKHRCKDGRIVDVEVSVNYLNVGGGQLFVFIRDITERKKVEETLRRSEERYRTILKEMEDSYFETDFAGNFTFVNDSTCRSLGYSIGEIIGVNYQIFTAKEDIEAVYRTFNEIYRTGKANKGFSWKIVRRDGALGFIEASISPSRDHNGKIIGFRAVGRDITERKQVEEALRESEERYHAIFEQAAESIILTATEDLAVVEFNDSAHQSLGYSREEFARLKVPDFEAIESIEENTKRRQKVTEGKIDDVFETKHRTKSGELRDVRVSVRPIRIGSKDFVLGISHDITERKKAEEALRASETQYRLLAEHMSDVVWIMDLDLNVTWISPSAKKARDYSLEEIAALPLDRQLTPESLGKAMNLLGKWMHLEKEGRTPDPHGAISVELEFICKDGHTLWLECSLQFIRDEQGKATGILAEGRDITERKKAEEDLRKFKAISEAAGYGIVIGNTDGIFEYVNQAFAMMHGYSVEELLGKHFSAINSAEQMKRVEELHNQLLQKGGYTGEEVWHRRKDGTVFLALMNATAIRDDKGNPLYFAVTSIDITERKQAEQELKLRSELLDSATDSIFVHDLEGFFIYVNEMACQVHGYSREEFMKLKLQDVVAPERVSGLNSDFREIVKKGQTVFESAHRRKDGSVMPVEVHGRAIELGKRKLLLTVIRDISERRRVEEERMQLEQKAQLASRLASVGELASGIAHEINNPLTGVIGYAQLLLTRNDLSKDIKHDIEVINEGAQRVAGVIRKLLTFARQTKPERKHVDINESIGTTLDLRAYELASNNIKVAQRLAQDLPITIADAGQLQQVFLNLIINAETEMKLAHGSGKLLIKTEQVDNTIQISFKDNGPGIAKQNLEKIFEPFFTTREVGQGTGLGLSVCHGIMTEHKGKIYAESKLGKGATFIVELPIITEDRKLELPEPAVEEPQKLTKAKILVVDDEPVIRQFVSHILGEEGHEVEAVDNAENALEKIRSKRYRLIVLDVKMPGMSGIELYEQIQEIAPSLAKRVVFITGDILGTRTTAFLAKTKAPHIVKPFEAKQFKTEINRILTGNM